MKTVEFNGLKLVLSTKQKIQLERALGNQSPLNVIFKMVGTMDTQEQEIDLSQMQLPSLEFLVLVLFHASQKLNSGINQEKMYDIVDSYLEDNHSVMDLFQIVLQVLQVSHYLPEAVEEEQAVEEE